MLAAAAMLVLLGAPLQASALALGAVQVKSALGEPLRADVEVPEISSSEASTFQATLGTPQEFQAAGVDFNQALRGTRITLNRRPNGQAYLRVEGQQPINEPFLGIVIDANWANGHVVRDYTLLIDPPPIQPATPAASAQTLPQTSAPAVAPPPPPPPPPHHPAASTGTATGTTATASAAASGAGDQVHVQRGDTAASIAQSHLTDGVSLDQMLVAMLRANPQAFIRGNVNLIRAGAVVNMPSTEQAAAISPTTARRTVIAQSRNFQAYRQGLAGTAARGGPMASGNRRSAKGRVQPQVQESGAAPTPQDRLTLSRGKGSGSTAAKRAEETRLAQSRQAQEQAAREAELRRNINELSQLATNNGGGNATATTPATPGINVPVPPGAVIAPNSAASTATQAASTSTAASTPDAPLQAASATDSASAPDAAASAASATASSPKPARRFVAPPPPPSGPSIWDTLQDNLGYLSLLVVLLVGGGGYLVYRGRQKARTASDSSAFAESRFSPDSFFGNSGGQRIDTRENHNNADAGSSMTYSPSQLEAAGDVDPISEADVYLAYGRDAQAEEILKEALRTYPGRASIYAKLAEIYAKRHDQHLLNALATEAHRVTRGKGHEWQVIAHLGRDLDPGNTLYKIIDAPAEPASSGSTFGADTEINPAGQPRPRAPGAGQAPARDATTASATPPATQPGAFQATSPGGFAGRAPVNYAQTMPAPVSLGTTITTAPSPLHVETVNFTPPTPAVPTAKAQSDSGPMEFDMSSMPAGLNAQPGGKPKSRQTGNEDPMATKLALAQEFHAIGDNDGARKLAKEVAAEASGTLKIQAVRLLTELG